MKFQRKVMKWGNSAGINLPKSLIGRVILVEMTFKDGKEVVLEDSYVKKTRRVKKNRTRDNRNEDSIERNLAKVEEILHRS